MKVSKSYFDRILFSSLRCLRSVLAIFCFRLRLLRLRPVDLPMAPPIKTGKGQLCPQTSAFRVRGVEVIEDPPRLAQHRIVVAGFLLHALEYRFQPLGVCRRAAAHVEKVHGGADRRERVEAARLLGVGRNTLTRKLKERET